MKVEGVESVKKKLNELAKQYSDSPNAVKNESVIVGYTANYALYVHENLNANHVVGEAKFLERPARELNNSGVLRQILVQAMRTTKKIQQALYLCGLRIQRDSQLRVPIDTGNLRGSAFTRKE